MSLATELSSLEADAAKVAPIINAFVAAIEVADPALDDVLSGAEAVLKAAVTGGVTLINDVESVMASVKAQITAAKAAAAPAPAAG